MKTKQELIEHINQLIEITNREIGFEKYTCLGNGWHKTKPYAMLDKSGIVEKRFSIMSMLNVLNMSQES